MNAPEAIEAYGRTIFCRKPLKPSNLKIDRSKRAEFLKNLTDGKKEKNVLDSFPPSSFDLEAFKSEFLEEKNKNNVMEQFWKEFDPKGYSSWWMEYKNLPSQGKSLFRMHNSKNFFLERIEDYFKEYAFGIHGISGDEESYKVRGVWLWSYGEEMKYQKK